MALSFEEVLIEVWRQALVENAKTVELGTEHFPVRPTPTRGLRQVATRFGSWSRIPRPNHVGTVGTVWQESDAVP